MEQAHIDSLLERYLGLLDEYTRLRQDLSTLQSGVYQNIARANFTGERGMRYGQDRYDQRMQALRLLTIGRDQVDVPIFTVAAPESKAEKVEERESQEEPADTEETADKTTDEKEEGKAQKPKPARNPLHWFGLFAPMPLRTAQQQSIQVVEDIIPRLVTVNAEMLSVEIEVRRARKRRAKAEASAKKQHDSPADTQSYVASVAEA